MSKEGSSGLKGFSFASITDRETGLKVEREIFFGYLTVAAIQGVIGAFVMRSMIWDALILAGLAFAFKQWHSRVAAVLLMLLSFVIGVTTVGSLLGMSNSGGRNIILAAIVVYMGLRATQVSFALHKLGDDDGDDFPIDEKVAEPPGEAEPAAPAAAAKAAPVPSKPKSMPQTFRRPEGHNIYD
jgi:hypothetical protein